MLVTCLYVLLFVFNFDLLIVLWYLLFICVCNLLLLVCYRIGCLLALDFW